jgi:hypothetical protein
VWVFVNQDIKLISISSCTGLFTFGEAFAFGMAFGIAFGEDILSIPLDKWSEKRHIQR